MIVKNKLVVYSLLVSLGLSASAAFSAQPKTKDQQAAIVEFLLNSGGNSGSASWNDEKTASENLIRLIRGGAAGGIYTASSQLTASALTQGLLAGGKVAQEMLSRFLIIPDKDPSVAALQLVIMNNNIYDSLSPYFTKSPADLTKKKRAEALEDDINGADTASSWDDERYTPLKRIDGAIDRTYYALERFKQKKDQQSAMWGITIRCYSLVGSEAIKPWINESLEKSTLETFDVILHNLRKLKTIIERSKSSHDLIESREDTKKYFTAMSKAIENYAREHCAASLVQLKEVNLRFARPTDQAGQNAELLAAIGQPA